MVTSLHNESKAVRALINSTIWRLWNDPEVQLALRSGIAQHVKGRGLVDVVALLNDTDIDDLAAWLARK